MNTNYLIVGLSYVFILFSLILYETPIDDKDVYVSQIYVTEDKSIDIKIKISNAMIDKIKYQGGKLSISPNNCEGFKISRSDYSVILEERDSYLLKIKNQDTIKLYSKQNLLCLEIKLNQTMNPFAFLYHGYIGPIRIAGALHENS